MSLLVQGHREQEPAARSKIREEEEERENCDSPDGLPCIAVQIAPNQPKFHRSLMPQGSLELESGVLITCKESKS